MAKRLIDSSLLVSPDFIDLGLKERWLWLGLLLICDDYGWCNSDPRFLKNRIAPSMRLSAEFIQLTLDTFEDRSMIIQRSFEASKCLQLLNFNFFNKLRRRRWSKYNELEKRREEKESREEILSHDDLKTLTRAAMERLKNQAEVSDTMQKAARKAKA